MGKTAARRAVRFKNDAATMRGSVTGAKTVADTVNSDAVSERSAKRVPLRAVFLQCQDGQRGSGIDSAVASRIRHRIAPRLGTEIFLQQCGYATSFRMRAMKFSCDLRLKFKRKARAKI